MAIKSKVYGINRTEYHSKVVKEFEKLRNAPDNSAFNLWFEYDLFCQVNMWFVISVINSLPIKKKVSAVYTSHLDKTNKQFWNGFGSANSYELKVCYTNKILLSEADINLGKYLWEAYKNGNLEELTNLSKNQSLAFPCIGNMARRRMARYYIQMREGKTNILIRIVQTK